jgi:rhamnosyltransferase
MTDADLAGTRPRRLVVYAVWDRRGGIEDFIPYALARLRPHAERIVVVVNGSLTAAGRAKLADVCDEVLVRENRGYDIWAHKHAIDHLGARIDEFDEVILTNDTWFGPVREFDSVLERMDLSSADFWGMTDHPREAPNPFTKSGVLPYHLQSYWIAVRRRMVRSEGWAKYWRDLPQMPDYLDAVLTHEAVFTEHFTTRGFTSDVAFPTTAYPTNHPALFNPDLLLRDGCPTLKRRPLFHWPPFLDRHAVVGRWIIEQVEQYGYPVELIWRNLARTVEPRVLNANAALHEVLPDTDVAYDPASPFRIVALLHIFYPEMTDEMLDLADNLPGRYDLVITTPDAGRAAEISDIVSRREQRGDVDVRVLASNDGRDQSAFLIGCRDVLLGDRYDLVVKLHSKKTPQDGFNVGRHFKRQQFSNLLASRGYVANLLALFQKEPGLGLVYPPMIHIGYPTMGRGWWSNKPGFAKYCERLGIHVPLDEISPLAPFGSMYIARPESLRLLTEHDWTYGDFGGAEAYRDGGLAHILERMPSYAAAELGYHTRTVSTAEYLSISHTSMEFNLDHLSATTTGDSVDRIMLLKQAGYVGTGRPGDFVRMYFGLHPRVGRLLGWSIAGAVRGKQAVSRLRSRRG